MENWLATLAKKMNHSQDSETLSNAKENLNSEVNEGPNNSIQFQTSNLELEIDNARK